MRRTKIVCTIGPASQSPDIIAALIQNGMNVARLNFSHGTQEEHEKKISMIRDISSQLNIPVAILMDLGGPKIRVGDIPAPGLHLYAGENVILSTREEIAEEGHIPVLYKHLPEDVKNGDLLLLADGIMELKVLRISSTDILCEVITGGVLTSHKGINLPTGTIHSPALTSKDRDDLLFGLEHGVDYVALSFVKSAEDIKIVRKIINNKKSDTPLIAKIEKHEAVANIDEILEASDGIMVARGDLGVEIPLERVPLLQKDFIKRANRMGKPVITATQMLRSMVESPRPTRAEATDVANAVLDGTYAVMLSEETASGNYPVLAVNFMDRIIRNAETGFDHDKFLGIAPTNNVQEAVARVTCLLAQDMAASAIVVPTQSGTSARSICRYHPRQPILALTPSKTISRRLTLYWGCQSHQVREARDTDDMIEMASREALKSGRVKKGDMVIITAGHPIWTKGTTNMIRVKKL